MDDLNEALAKDDVCPKCLGELDTGWECTKCGYDAQADAMARQFAEEWAEAISPCVVCGKAITAAHLVSKAGEAYRHHDCPFME